MESTWGWIHNLMIQQDESLNYFARHLSCVLIQEILYECLSKSILSCIVITFKLLKNIYENISFFKA